MKYTPIDQKLCRHLKARTPYGLTEGGENPWYLLDKANTICWCIKSASGVGPDNGLVSHSTCLPGRKCYSGNND